MVLDQRLAQLAERILTKGFQVMLHRPGELEQGPSGIHHRVINYVHVKKNESIQISSQQIEGVPLLWTEEFISNVQQATRTFNVIVSFLPTFENCICKLRNCELVLTSECTEFECSSSFFA
jgi:hypothetical protein